MGKPKKKKTVQELLKSKRRDQRKKGQRLARRALTETVAKLRTNERTWANLVAVRRKGEVIFGVRTGLFGHPTTTVLKVEDEKIVGAVEDTKELGEIVTQLGLLALGAMVNYNLAMGPDGLARALARWARIDLTELEKKAEEEALAAVQAGIEAQKSEGPTQPATVEGFPTESDDSPSSDVSPGDESGTGSDEPWEDHSDCEQCTGYSPYPDLDEEPQTEEQPEAPADQVIDLGGEA